MAVISGSSAGGRRLENGGLLSALFYLLMAIVAIAIAVPAAVATMG